MLPPLSLVDIEAQLALVTSYWSPRVIARVNDQYVKVAKLKGEFVWHAHQGEDELFLIVRGQLRIQFEAGDVTIGPGQFVVVPKGMRHNPVCEEECWIVLVEPVTTLHTGDVATERTRSVEEQLAD